MTIFYADESLSTTGLKAARGAGLKIY